MHTFKSVDISGSREAPVLSPTLWRTCRVLANRRRLVLVKAMVDAPPQTVSALAQATGMPLALCSLYLKNLQSRGVCRAERQGKFVRYSLAPDPAVTQSAPIVSVLLKTFRENADGESIFHVLTAFTHPTRIKILGILLIHRRLDPARLAMRAACSQAALSRHLAKLASRDLVVLARQEICLKSPPTRLGRALLALVNVQGKATP